MRRHTWRGVGFTTPAALFGPSLGAALDIERRKIDARLADPFAGFVTVTAGEQLDLFGGVVSARSVAVVSPWVDVPPIGVL